MHDEDSNSQNRNWKDASDSCAYCGVCEESSVVKCCGCEKWFCNGNTNTAGSHIVNHLVRSRHKAVALHESSPLGDSTLECFNCGSRNVFLLGFIPSKQDNVVVLLCREPCLASNQIGSLKDSPNWDLSLWQPLVEERAFVPWLVKTPDLDEEDQYNPLTNGQINQLEELWRKDPKATLDEAQEAISSELTLEQIPLSFEDAFHYQRVFSPLVKREADYDLRLKESQSSQNVSVRWEQSLTKRRLCYFMFTREEHEKKLTPGDELRISIENFEPASGQVLATSTMATSTWEGLGYVIKVLASEEICVELKPQFVKGPWETTRGFKVSFVWKSVTFDRMQNALKAFATDDTSLSGIVYRVLLGQDVEVQLAAQLKIQLPTSFRVPGLPQLNHSQIYAIRKALSAPVCTLQGPPGTGKTVTASALVYLMSKQTHAGQILVCAPSNIACDHLSEKLHLTGLKVVRVSAKSREEVPSSVDFLTLHSQVKQLISSTADHKELLKLTTLKEAVGELSVADERRYRQLRQRVEARILDNADVVCCTCVSAADPRVARLRFKHVLIDEATQATEPECLIPLVMGAKQLVLVGDHCQLGPVILDKVAARAGFNQSLFQRLLDLGVRPLRLEVQYRMHPALSEFPSQTFYEGALQNGVTLADRQCCSDFPWPRPDLPLMFYHSSGTEEISGSGTSYLNRAEALNIERLVSQFIKSGMQGSQIGVITPYEGQRAHIQSVLQRHTTLHASMYRDIEIASVDAFQGREKDFIILSCVRSNSHAGLGFLHDPRRLNVALTRAKYGLVLCGNALAISRAPGRNGVPSVWSGLISHLQKHSLIVEGPLANLRQIQFTLGNVSTVSKGAPTIPIETNANVESFVKARASYFETDAEGKKTSSSRRRTHSVDSAISTDSYQSQKIPPRVQS